MNFRTATPDDLTAINEIEQGYTLLPSGIHFESFLHHLRLLASLVRPEQQ